MGLVFIENTLRTNPSAVIYHLNRGNDYWNNKIKQLHEEFGDRLRHKKCDRRKRAVDDMYPNGCNNVSVQIDLLTFRVLGYC